MKPPAQKVQAAVFRGACRTCLAAFVATVALAPAAEAAATAETPFQVLAGCVMDAGAGSCQTNFKVPDGQTFRIQTIAVARNGSPTGTARVTLFPAFNSTFATVTLPDIPVDTLGFPGVTVSLTAYAQGKKSQIRASRSQTSDGESVSFSLFGVLIATQ